MKMVATVSFQACAHGHETREWSELINVHDAVACTGHPTLRKEEICDRNEIHRPRPSVSQDDCRSNRLATTTVWNVS